MNTAQLLLAVVSIATTILGPACSQQALPLTLAPTVINQGDGVCPSDLVRESAREDIHSSVQELLQTAGFTTVEECGEGLWRRVAFLNMSDPTEQCPSAWRLYDQDNVRACGRNDSDSGGCPATFYNVNSGNYNKVCGRIIGYQFATPDAFFSVIDQPPAVTPDDFYVDGVSVTHGSPRSHIWTFAGGHTDQQEPSGCPCATESAAPSPSFIGNDYFCESGNPGGQSNVFFSNDPLWDGQGCPSGSCCSFNFPPWFSVELPSPTTDDIEVRICADQDTNDEDTPIGLIEIYVQ